MESMTGFGNGSQLVDKYKITVLVKSVNNKGLGLHFRMPREAAHLEEALYRRGKALFSRGRIDVNVSVETDSGRSLPEPDITLARAYLEGADALAKEFFLTSSPDAFRLVTLSGMMRVADPSEGEGFDKNLVSAVEEAFQRLLLSRREEGNGLSLMFAENLKRIGELSGPVADGHGQRVAHLFTERKKRITEMLDGAVVDENRLAQEMALLSDRIDIAEEYQRLMAHIQSGLAVLDDNGCGRKLGFILQEMHRELNTMGSKVDNSEAVHQVIEMKDVLGGLREQVANVQ
ncbi:MAG: YicC family protein [Candidatus Sabulitectum sp.]|nr:YicC family protein [Candidatus Sabulitectum sp.]